MSFTSSNNSGSTLYHCPCGAAGASTSYHRLPSLYFCEECDSIRCPECVLEEVSSYYCPNCLFEVPTASVRAEKNRCARNCFSCPCCNNTLAVVPSDPSDTAVRENPLSPQASIGEPPYYLSCLACRWDSRIVNITFDKPTGLAAQLQKLDDNSPAVTEYERIRDHLEPWLKAGLQAEQAASRTSHKSSSHSSSHHHSHAHPHPTNPIAAAARALSHSNSTISRDIPSSIASASRFNSLHNLAAMHRSNSLRSGLGKVDPKLATTTSRDELAPYISSSKGKGKGKTELHDLEEERSQSMKSVENLEEIAKLEQRWCASSHNQTIKMNELRPLRIPLCSKKTKRCPVCKHIVVKPDLKAASTRFKIRLVASNYLPQIDVHRRIPPSLGSRLSAVGASGSASLSRRGRVSTSGGTTMAASAVETLVAIGSTQDIAEPLRPGRTFSFQLTFTNPLYDAVEVLVELLDPLNEEGGEEDEETRETEGEVVRGTENPAKAETKQAWNVSMPSPSFGINPYAEAWEYEDEEDETETSIDGLAATSSSGGSTAGTGTSSSSSGSRRRKHGPGILAKKGNKTAVQLDLAVGREASAGEIRVSLFITYTYTVEDSLATTTGAKKKDADAQKLKEETETKAEKTEGDSEEAETANSNFKSFSFWASIPLGKVVPRSAVPGGGSTLSVIAGHGTGEARRVPSSNNLRVQ